MERTIKMNGTGWVDDHRGIVASIEATGFLDQQEAQAFLEMVKGPLATCAGAVVGAGQSSGPATIHENMECDVAALEDLDNEIRRWGLRALQRGVDPSSVNALLGQVVGALIAAAPNETIRDAVRREIVDNIDISTHYCLHGDTGRDFAEAMAARPRKPEQN